MGQMENVQHHDLIYKLNDKPPVLENIFAAFQHICAILIPIMVPGYIVAGAIGCDFKTTTSIISTCLIFSGLGTLLQAKKIGPIGSGLLSIQGTSFGFVSILIVTGKLGGMPLVVGVCLIGVIVQLVVAYFLPRIKDIFPPVVSGTVVCLIGVTLMEVAIDAMCGGAVLKGTDSYALPKYVLLSLLVVFLIIFFQCSKIKILRIGCIMFASLIGFIISIPMGMVDLIRLGGTEMLHIPTPFQFGVSFKLDTIIPILIIFFVTSIEAIGDITATAAVSGENIKDHSHMKRLSGGVLAGGIGSLISSVFGGFPLACFAQNNGIIQMTGVASRRIGYYIAGFLVICGMFPAVSQFFQLIPQPVLGGAMVMMFGTIIAAGIKILSVDYINRRSLIIISVAIACGMAAQNGAILSKFPAIISYSFSSGIGTGGLVAIFLNMILPKERTIQISHSAQES